MRLWSLHPCLLDQPGLNAVWREALGAQAVLAALERGETPGYREHSALERFKRYDQPLVWIGTYLHFIWMDATRRGYHYNHDLIEAQSYWLLASMPVTRGQRAYEWQWLRHKLARRSPDVLARLADVEIPPLHPLFYEVPGDVEDWERVKEFAHVG
jgi:hypothetical protein